MIKIKIFKILLPLIALSLFATTSNAHEGHNKTPGQVAAPHGGKIKGSDHYYFELVIDNSSSSNDSTQQQVKLYVTDHDLKKIESQKLNFKTYLSLPKSKQREELKLTSQNDFYLTQFDIKNSHRYTIDIELNEKSKKEKISFTVEP